MIKSPVQPLSPVEPDEQPQPSDSLATRHLCAGTYVDRSFRDLIIRKIHNKSRRRVAPSYGYDLVPVVRHAWQSWLLDLGQQVAIITCVVTGVIEGGLFGGLIVGCAIAVWAFLRLAARTLVRLLHVKATLVAEEWFGRRESVTRLARGRRELRKPKRQLKFALSACGVFAVTPIVVANAFGVSLRAAAPGAIAIGAGLVVCAITAGVVRQLILNAVHRRRSLRPKALTGREMAIDDQQTHPCVVYQRPAFKGEIDPLDISTSRDVPSWFIGSGEFVNRWLPPMTVQLLRRSGDDMVQREYTRSPFTAHQLVERLRSALWELGSYTDPESLPGLQVRDRIYVAEADVSSDRSLLRGDFGGAELREIINDHRATAHHFLETSVPIAGGELVATVLIRVSVKGRALSLDVATCALTRTPGDYQVIDAYAEHGTSAVIRSAVRSVVALPLDVLRCWRLLEAPVVIGLAWWATKDRTQRPRWRTTVGPRVAVREETADVWDNAQLDKTTIYDHMKIIEQRILKATEDFLESHDVDTSAFEKQATNIINSGILNMGGKTEVSQSAVGIGAQLNQVVAAVSAQGENS